MPEGQYMKINHSKPAEQSLPSYGKLSFAQLGQDVNEATMGVRRPYDFGDLYPGHAMCGINFNSLARIVDKYHAALASAPVAGEAQPVAWRALWTLPTPGATAWSDARKATPPDETELLGKGYSLELAYAAPPARAEPLARYCPGCGSVDPVGDEYRDCCPDGNQARMIPARLAEQCRDTFRLAIKSLRADAAANDSAAPQASEAIQLLRKVCEDGYLSDTMNHRIAVFFAGHIQACEAVRILFPMHLRKMWSGGEVQAWLDERQGISAPQAEAKGSLGRYRKWLERKSNLKEETVQRSQEKSNER